MRNGIYILLTVFVLSACSKDDPNPNIRKGNPPAGVQLVFPLKNSECNEGRFSTDTETSVTFEWQAVEGAESYELFLTNLFTSDQNSFSTTMDTLPVVLQRATPYSWFVEASVSGADSNAVSEVWKFYVSGEGVQQHVPFPAEIVSPLNFSNITAPGGSVTLDWEGSDLDDDIIAYDVYFGTTDPPPLLTSDTNQSEVSNVNVSSGTIYYWSVTTKDAYGNASESEVAQFKVE